MSGTSLQIEASADSPTEAASLARQMPSLLPAQLLLADNEALQGHWSAAAQRYAALTRDNVSQVLQPILVAWAQQSS